MRKIILKFCAVIFVVWVLKFSLIGAVEDLLWLLSDTLLESRRNGLSIKFFLMRVYGFNERQAVDYVKSLDDLLAESNKARQKPKKGDAFVSRFEDKSASVANAAERRESLPTLQPRKVPPRRVAGFADVDVTSVLKPFIDLRRFPHLRNVLSLPDMPLDFVATQRGTNITVQFLHPKRDKFVVNTLRRILRKVVVKPSFTFEAKNFFTAKHIQVVNVTAHETALAVVVFIFCAWQLHLTRLSTLTFICSCLVGVDVTLVSDVVEHSDDLAALAQPNDFLQKPDLSPISDVSHQPPRLPPTT